MNPFILPNDAHGQTHCCGVFCTWGIFLMAIIWRRDRMALMTASRNSSSLGISENKKEHFVHLATIPDASVFFNLYTSATVPSTNTLPTGSSDLNLVFTFHCDSDSKCDLQSMCCISIIRYKCETCCTKNQGREVLCCSLQGCCSSQRLSIHGGEDAVEAGQSPGLYALHPTINMTYQDLSCKTASTIYLWRYMLRWTSTFDHHREKLKRANYLFIRPLQEGFWWHTSVACVLGNSVFLRTLNQEKNILYTLYITTKHLYRV